MPRRVKVSLICGCDVLQHVISVKAPDAASFVKDSFLLDHSESDLSLTKKSTWITKTDNDMVLNSVQSSSVETSSMFVLKDKVVLNEARSYFDGHYQVSSDHHFSNCSWQMNYEQIVSTLHQCNSENVVHLNDLKAEHQHLFHKWMFHLCNGVHLLLFGVGSKCHLLDDFLDTFHKGLTHIVINGYFPNVTVKNILNAITEDVMGCRSSFLCVLDQCNFIQQSFQSAVAEQNEVLLVIQNIDGLSLRSRKLQGLLSFLAKVNGIRIIATTDHVNGYLLWDQLTLSGFNWASYDVTTYDFYDSETSFENSMLIQQTASIQLSSLLHVLHSLTHNARTIFCILATYQVDNAISSTYSGLSFHDLYQKCRESFLVSSDLTLHAQLTEFHDHKLIRMKKGVDGIEYLTIPLETTLLSEFLSEHEEHFMCY